MTVFIDARSFARFPSPRSPMRSARDPQTGCVQVNSPSRLPMKRCGSWSGQRRMSPEVLEHAFDPFYLNRPAGRGRGLGLSRAYRLAEINGGRLWIDSTPNVGTTVTIELPSRAGGVSQTSKRQSQKVQTSKRRNTKRQTSHLTFDVLRFDVFRQGDPL